PFSPLCLRPPPSSTLFPYTTLFRSVVDALGNRTTLGYDSASNQIKVKNPLGKITTSLFDNLNRVQAVINPLGRRTTNVYDAVGEYRKSTRLNSSHVSISYAVFCLKK